jgi:hypothetical protein
MAHVDGGLKERHALVSKVHARAHSSWLAGGGEGAAANYDEGPISVHYSLILLLRGRINRDVNYN